MYINNNIQAVSGAYQVSNARPSARAGAAQESGKGDEVVFSHEAKRFSSMLQELRNMPEVRSEKVEALSRQIADGSYDQDADKLAGSLLDARY